MAQPLQITLPQLEALRLVDQQGRPLVESEPLLPAETIEVFPLAFGDTDVADRRIVEHPFAGAWREERYEAAPVRLYRLRDACVHSTAGVVMVGGRLVAETLQHVYPPEHGLDVDPDTGFTTLNSSAVRRVPGRAVHLLAAGAFNYYHWQIDVASRFAALPDGHRDDLILVPPLEHGFQRDSLERLAAQTPIRVHAIGTAESVIVDELILVPNFCGFGYYPRRKILDIFDRMAAHLTLAPPHRRLYVTRARSLKRRLRDEEWIVEWLAREGFEVLDLDGLSLDAQIQAFAEATHIVSPHGAGLTNLAFCRQAPSVCELQMDCYTNWLFRRLANLRGARYGCVIGTIDGEWEPVWPHNRSWSLPRDRLESTLAGAGFFA